MEQQAKRTELLGSQQGWARWFWWVLATTLGTVLGKFMGRSASGLVISTLGAASRVKHGDLGDHIYVLTVRLPQ